MSCSSAAVKRRPGQMGESDVFTSAPDEAEFVHRPGIRWKRSKMGYRCREVWRLHGLRWRGSGSSGSARNYRNLDCGGSDTKARDLTYPECATDWLRRSRCIPYGRRRLDVEASVASRRHGLNRKASGYAPILFRVRRTLTHSVIQMSWHTKCTCQILTRTPMVWSDPPGSFFPELRVTRAPEGILPCSDNLIL